MKNLLKIFLICISSAIIYLLNPASIFSQGTYFNNADFVFLRDGETENLDSAQVIYKRTIYWDLSPIDTNADRLDIAIGSNEIDEGSNTDYLWGNWLRNEDNVNFNYENPNLRFIYSELPAIGDSITGLTFINLKENEKNIWLF
ncbi:MAG: hypothetical protein IPL53_25450 [Ignavibacteria bacterium]|nr:hypothetical protein [Ignavibacteria bacterium]